MNLPDYVAAIPALAELAGEADDIHVMELETRKGLRGFLSAALSYMPGWMRGLYRVRKYFVLLLGARRDTMPEQHDLAPEDVSFTPGEMGAFFTILAAEEDSYWIGEASDRMISGYLGAVAEPLGGGRNRIYLVSGARYRHWTGRVYYHVILPFHHLVIRCMARHAIRD